MISRREFLDRSGRIALSVGALRHVSPVDVSAGRQGRDLSLESGTIAATWTVTDDSIRPARIIDRIHGVDLPVSAELFSFTIGNGPNAVTLPASTFRIAGNLAESLDANPKASRFSERLGGRRLTVILRDSEGRIEVVWRAVLRDGSSYIRQELSVRSLSGDVPLRDITMFDFNVRRSWVSGTVRGSPIVVGDAYYALEHPLANNGVDGDRLRCRMARTLPLRPGTMLEVSAVVGVTRTGQLRRDFLAYVERERAHPYRTFLHYNSWYDIGYFSKYNEADALAAIAAFGTELHEKRGVTLDSYLFDDGWDDPTTLWRFHSGFPNGFAKLAEETKKFGAAPGV